MNLPNEMVGPSKVLSFLSWALFTFFSHYFAKYFFNVTPTQFMIEEIILITTFQVGFGALLFLWFGSNLTSKDMTLGACHSYGMLMTNSGLALATASLTLMVKNSEPVFTTIIMACMGKIVMKPKIIIIIFAIVFTAIGSEPFSNVQSSIWGVLFALASNICYALRNIGTKYYHNEDSKETKTTLAGFAAISYGGLLSLTPLWVYLLLFRFNTLCTLLELRTMGIIYIVIISSLSHVVYNSISLTIILSSFNPAQHSILNIGKRTSIVLVFFVLNQKTFGTFNVVSAVSCILLCILAVADKIDSAVFSKVTKNFSWIFFGSLLLIGALLASQKGCSNLSLSDSVPKKNSATENWHQCIADIQTEIISSFSDKLKDPALLHHPSPLLLVDPSYTGNVGDSLITYGQLVLAESMGYLKHTECGFLQSVGLNEDCGNFTQFPSGGLAFWQGGGNWGPTVWSTKGWTMWRMMSFIKLMKKGRTVIGMPQSIQYFNKENEQNEAKEWMDAALEEADVDKLKEKIILAWRQFNSFDSGSNLYPLFENRLVPDIALMIGPLEETKVWTKNDSKVDIMFFLRSDGESLHKKERDLSVLRKIIDDNNDARGLSFDIVDWDDRPRFYQDDGNNGEEPQLKYKVKDEGKFDFQEMFKSSIGMFAASKVMIVDRLHASILAFLLHKPHVFLDQNYGKIRKTREVAFRGSELCRNKKDMRYDEAETMEEAVAKAYRLLRENNL